MREKQISAAGRELERVLGLVGSHDTLARWMAYRLAELRQDAESLTDPDGRRAAARDHENLILRLWAQKDSMPVKIGFDERLAGSLEILEALTGADGEWARLLSRGPLSPGSMLEALKIAQESVARTALALIYERGQAAAPPDDSDLPLDPTERELDARLTDLRNVLLVALSEPSFRPCQEKVPRGAGVDQLAKGLRVRIADLKALLDQAQELFLPAAKPRKSSDGTLTEAILGLDGTTKGKRPRSRKRPSAL